MVTRFRRLVDPDGSMTNLAVLKYLGLFKPDDSWRSQLHARLVEATVLSAIAHFAAKVALDFNKVEILKLMEVVHWLCLVITSQGVTSSMIARSDDFREMHNIITAGFHRYPQPTSDQDNVIQKAKNEIYSISKFFAMLFTSSIVCLEVKGLLFRTEEWQLPFPGWFPFEIDSVGTYIAGIAYQLLMLVTLYTNSYGFLTSYIVNTSHLVAHLDVLQLALSNIGKESNSFLEVKSRLKTCIQHHIVIIRYYKILSKYYSIPLFMVSISMCLAMCMVGFVVTDPDINSNESFGLVSILVLEFLATAYLCVFGQRVIDSSDGLCQKVYETDWYSQYPELRKDFLLMMIATKEAYLIKGGGLQQFSLKGLREILQTTYSYFNMLSLMRNSTK